MDVGFIGLGHMGAPMALNLLKAGHRVTVYNRTRGKAEALAREGAQVAERVADACRGDALITMLSDDRAVEDVVFSEDGALNALGRNAIHISMSTISVALSDRLAEAHGKAGQGYVAAPVFGRPEAAAAARLFIIAAGADATIARCQPLFDAMGQQTFVISAKPSEANLVKLTGNFLIASMLESLGEAFALVRKSGLDPHRYLNILTSTLLSAPVYRTYGSIIAEDRLPADGFKMSLGLKDMRLALAAADARTVPMPVASLVRDHFFEAVGTSCSRSPEGSNRTSSRISTKRHWSTSSTRSGRANPSRPRRGPAARMSSLVDALRQSIHQASSSLAKPAKKPRGRRLAKRRC